MTRALAVEALARRLDRTPRDFALLDVREAGEAELGHIPGATAFPRRVIEVRAAALLPGLATPIVIYDGADGRAGHAAATLEALGYRDVALLDGGLPAWTRAGRPVARGVNVPSKRFGEEVLEHDRVACVTADGLAALHAAGAPLLQWDVRTPAEYRRATIPGSVSYPGVEIVGGAAEAARHDGPVVVHCAGRTRGIIAARTLALLGVTRVVAIENGTMGWRLAGRRLAPGGRPGPPGSAASGSAASGSAASGSAAMGARDLAAAAGVGWREPGALAAALARRGDRPVIVVDVRSEAERAGRAVAESVGCPGGQLIQGADDVLLVPGVPVVLLDEGDGRAAMTAYWLRRMGFPHVDVLRGGLPAWAGAGLPLASGVDDGEPPAVRSAKAAARSVGVGAVEGARVERAGGVLLDVGTSRAYRAGHIPGAAWLPRGWIEARIGEIARPPAALVVTAQDDGQAALAAATLSRLGYDAAWLRGGNDAWVAAGRALTAAAALPIACPPDVVDPPYARGEAGMRDYLAWEIALTRPASAPVR